MYRALVIRAGWISLCLLTIATASFSQPAPDTTKDPTPGPTPLRIIYTGKSFGYFRSPNLQLSDATTGCRADSGPSKAAVQFLSGPLDAEHPKRQIEQQTKFASAIRVSTGDNFAPQLEAREFSDSGVTAYMPGNKELYSWYKGQWIRLEDPKLPKATRDAAMAEAAKGTSTIPTDNVACFLSAAHYDAIVPGKHDFYFGPERVRMLARFMAGIGDTRVVNGTSDPGFRPVQMLGANLVIKTVSTEPATAAPNQPKLPGEYSVEGLRDGKSIYPWFSSSVQLKVKVSEDVLQKALTKWFKEQEKKPDAEHLEAFLKQRSDDSTQPKEAWNKLYKSLSSLHVCPAADFNEITCDAHGWRPVVGAVTLSENTITYTMKIGHEPATLNEQNPHYATIEGGKKYGLCVQVPKEEKGRIENETDCYQFSVYTPFFYSPGAGPHYGADYKDPAPFVLKENREAPDREVAIFGVVDPAISEQVGVLNFSWLTDDPKSKSVVSAEEPVEALQEQLEYFKDWYEKKGRGEFSGLKVLLAQMSPQHARLLAARLKSLRMGEFQIVVTAADEEQSTSETTLTTEFSRKTRAGTLVAVPAPYFDTRQEDTTDGTVHFGLIEASTIDGGWRLAGSPLNKAEITKAKISAEVFGGLVSQGLRECLPAKFQKGALPVDDVHLLTLCAMRERLGADVAMLQKRDFFDKLPLEAGDGAGNAQRILDRRIWKGDLLILLYLPGSAIKKALEQSKKYDDDDDNSLSLSDERKRGLLYLGIKKVNNEFLINESPIDDKKIYGVATTDYIGAGDTGYSDLATAINPKTRAVQFPNKLVPISGLVCRKLFAGNANPPCLPDFNTETYLDSTIAKAPPSPRPRGFGNRLHDLFPFKTPKDPVAPTTPNDMVEQRAQHRPIWLLSLKNLSLQFSSLNNNLTDAQIDQKYGGITTPGITTHENHNITFGLGARLSRSSHRRELFAEIGMDYKEQSTGVSNTTPQVAQLTNRVTADLGVVRDFRGGRSPITWGGKLSLHAETTLKQPFTTFTLGTQTVVDPANNIKVQDRLTISQKRAVLLLPRAGLRLQNRANSLEFGFEGGKEIYALSGFRFTTQGTVDTCLASATKSLASCIKSKSTPPNATITKDSAASAILEDRWRAGAYWKFTFSIPFTPKVKYDLTQEADFFFVNFHRDNPTDIRYRDSSKNSLKFMVLPNFSIGPTLQLLFYQNKVNRDFLFQKQFGIEASFAFDLFNRREKGVQIKHKP